MSILIVPTTELEAVNECLENIGQAPVSTISGDLGVDTQMALSFVRKVNRALQSQGWYWNTDKEFTLSPNNSGSIVLPINTLSVDSTGTDQSRDVVQRGRYLYDRTNHTYTFTEAIKVDLVVGLPFEELPETARRFISLRASRLFQNRIEGSADREDAEDEMMAMSALHADELRVSDENMLTGSAGMRFTLSRNVFGY